ncbi:MAG: ABC transporter ATP-binding protein [Anaerolineales bacterium]|nr:ABC transporter ATP-binding protein [Anaerolineales bacterium]
MTRSQIPKAKQPLLKVEGLKTHFFVDGRVIRAVDHVDLEIFRGEVFGLVGESGCGKTVTALSIMGLIDEPGRIIGGNVIFDDISLLALSEDELNRIRGGRISLIFQDPQVRLNPVFTVGSQLAEIFQVHYGEPREAAFERSVQLFETVGLPDPLKRVHAYPHELSGGQAQRVMIAMALALEPELIIADEPTTALDVTIQAQILDLMRAMRVERSTAIILITHDLGVIAGMADRVAVMYAGQIVEQAKADDLYGKPMHPYTQGLLASIPYGLDEGSLASIPGSPPDPGNLPTGCRYAPRCEARVEYGLKICDVNLPSLQPSSPEHSVRCWLYQSAPGHEPPLSSPDSG